MKQIALYGKGGIGKSTTSANMSAALSLQGLDIMQIGCDPKRDSTRMLMHGSFIPTVMDLVRVRGEAALSLPDIVYTGFNGVRCVEAGGPEPGVGCAGRGIIATFQLLEKFGALRGDVIVYDVLGDVVCGGFAMPMREGYAQDIYLVTSGELMSLYAANNICKAIKRLSSRTKSTCRLAGVICNAKNQPHEEELVAEFARRVNSSLIQYIPRDRVVQLAELNRKTVLEYDPGSDQAAQYRSLAARIMKNTRFTIPTPLEIDDLESLAIEYI
ncbi:MAG: Ni-sirohydrochlorin a,c-diamide reductive cyclase ATP-dependent reductase subunit [Methanoregula sp.]|jgi:nitrogenase iron protein NifH|nr:Ni-sirohydrochlorin a,c-diamide reductive cyclase ATP-dependent reductase subunit [Methanoregula sp.]